jgi:hypothetical protein
LHWTTPPLSVELTQRAFDADCAFSAALVAVQVAGKPTSLAALLAKANEQGFSWIIKAGQRAPEGYGWKATLRHIGGAEESGVGETAALALASLLGFPTLGADRAVEPEIMQNPHPAPKSQQQEPDRAPDPVEADPQPEPAAAAEPGSRTEQLEPDPATPLSEEQIAAALEMVKVMGQEQRKAFTISFRSAFSVPREVKAVAPLIRQLQHLHFVDRFTVEAAGGLAP